MLLAPNEEEGSCILFMMQDINAMMRTCVANLIIITQLSDDKNLEKKACINFKYHPWWPVFELST